jgi:hypothetical protein
MDVTDVFDHSKTSITWGYEDINPRQPIFSTGQTGDGTKIEGKIDNGFNNCDGAGILDWHDISNGKGKLGSAWPEFSSGPGWARRFNCYLFRPL